ncbi:unnamed protein product [Orchesella dallaii]|uniref:C2H2-type domain-containing protein n=1 Tax=Orchesella dallaii TaxID=48710 RepID=A0ABP1R393_9HEXA
MSRKQNDNHPSLSAVAQALLDENCIEGLATLASLKKNTQVPFQLDGPSIPEPESEVEIETTRGNYISPKVSVNEHADMELVESPGSPGPCIVSTYSVAGNASDINKEIEVPKLVEIEKETQDANNSDGQLLSGKGKAKKNNGITAEESSELDSISASQRILIENGIRPPRKIYVPLDGTQTAVLQCSICYLAFINDRFLLKHIKDKHQSLLREISA